LIGQGLLFVDAHHKDRFELLKIPRSGARIPVTSKLSTRQRGGLPAVPSDQVSGGVNFQPGSGRGRNYQQKTFTPTLPRPFSAGESDVSFSPQQGGGSAMTHSENITDLTARLAASGAGFADRQTRNPVKPL
jgi:hypothetical protein